MKGYPGLTNILTEQDKIIKKRLVIKNWCAWANSTMNNIKYMRSEYGRKPSINQLHSYIFSYIVYGYWIKQNINCYQGENIEDFEK